MPSRSQSPQRKAAATATFDIDKEIDFSDLETKYKVEVPQGFGHVIVVDHLPIVDDSKRQKLLDVLKGKILGKEAGIQDVVDDDIQMPKDNATDKSYGFAFITLKSAEEAELAVKKLHGFRLDKSHVLAVNLFDEVESYVEMSDEYKEPEIDAFVEKDHLRSWLADERGRDQWVMMKADDCGIYWNNKTDVPSLVHNRQNWSDTYVQWSPKGTYLATFHRQGIILWGGASFAKIVRFPHQGVRLLDFSPNEKYVVTWSFEPFLADDGQQHHIAVWDLPTGQKLRTFSLDPSVLKQTENSSRAGMGAVKVSWPIFKWSYDDKYLAKITTGPNGMISVYETPGMGLIDKKSIKIADVQAFEWSPTDHILSYWTPESGNIPARVTLMKIPSREIIRTKNLFNVIECKLHWQSAGAYLLVRVERTKSKKQTAVNFELFRMKEKDIPVDVVETKPNETVGLISWEPEGDRFVVLSTENQKVFANFYQMLDTSTGSVAGVVEGCRLVKTVERKGINQVYWSPKGRICVLASIRCSQGEVEFWDADDVTMMSSGEHYTCTDIEWDPSGRYLVSSVSFWQQQTDTGYILWSMTGQQLYRENIPQFKQLLWRPRPSTLLSKEQQKAIRKNLKEYSREFDEIDTARTTEASREVVEKRQALFKEWLEFRSKCIKEYNASLQKRVAIWGFNPDVGASQNEGEELEEIVEDVIDETEEVLE